ncbi:hypothetical protein M0R19_03940 [Candidatus Pacearchaeota archaeon]|nr:hypothetical protein [Candidatus Pacearchaeota archaeon]
MVNCKSQEPLVKKNKRITSKLRFDGKKKSIYFFDTEERLIQLGLDLQNDGIDIVEFFRLMTTGYLKKDKSILDFIVRYKENNNIFKKYPNAVKVEKMEKEYMDKAYQEDVNQLAKYEEIDDIFGYIDANEEDLLNEILDFEVKPDEK